MRWGGAMGAWTTPPSGYVHPAVTVSFPVPLGTGKKHKVTTEMGQPPSRILGWLRGGRNPHRVPGLVRGRTSPSRDPRIAGNQDKPLSDSRDCRETEHPNPSGILGWLSSSSQGGHGTDISHFSLIFHQKQKEKLCVSFRPPSSSWGTLSKGCVSGTLKPCT